MELLTDPLRAALGQLETHMGLSQSSLGGSDPKREAAFRTAAIKSFEYSYELAVKLVRRRLEMVANAPEAIDQLDFRKLMQLAAEQELVSGWQVWMTFRHKRNITSHAYDAAVANEIFVALPGFVVEGDVVLAALDRVSADAP